jgi:putative membrane-bound dehydrogenase-like protein
VRDVLAFGLFLAASVAVAQEPAVPKGFHQAKLNGHTFTLPDGFSIELAARSPLVDRPITMSFDEKGRLYVADPSGDNRSPAEQWKTPTHRVVRLEATKGDGVFDKSVVFADGLPYLQGTLWYGGSLYVAAPPRILKLTDIDGDGVVDKRETWFDGGTLTGCANDLHGPYLGPDGLFYWTKGAFAEQTLKLKAGNTLTTRAAHVLRANPDGSGVEVVMTGGMDNPVGLAFLPTGEVFCTCTFVQHPAGGKRDAILHLAYGAVYGKDHAPVREQPWTDTALAEPMTHLGPAAPAGLHAYRSTHFGREFAGNLFSAQFNLARVGRHVLRAKGGTFETTDSAFVASDSRDFHPTDVVEDRDGSLLIADTGGWYKMCCPSSVLEKKEILGAIYRVRKINGAAAEPAPWPPAAKREVNNNPVTLAEKLQFVEAHGRGMGPFESDAVMRVLDDAADATLERAVVRALIDRADEAGCRRALAGATSPRHKRAALLALAGLRPGSLDFATVRPLLSDPDARLREAAWFQAERRPDWAADVAAVLDRWLMESPGAADRGGLAARMATFAPRPEVQKVMARHAGNPAVTAAMAAARPGHLVAAWQPVLADLLTKSPSAETARTVFDVLAGTPNSTPLSDGLRAALARVAGDEKLPAEVRLQAIARSVTSLGDEAFPLVLGSLTADKPGTLRSAATDILTRARLTDAQLAAVAESLPRASPLELPRLLEVFKKSDASRVGETLMVSLARPTVRPAVRVDQLRGVVAKYPAAVRDAARKLEALLAADREDQKKKLDDLRARMKPGDAKRGHTIFTGAKASCAACHTIGYVGGAVGPDLSRVGSIRSETDLLEAIVFPSASFVRSYEPVTVTTLDGRAFSGIVKTDSPAEVVLALSATDEVRIPRADIELMKPGTVSIMPAGLDQQLSVQELADLLAFLKGRK